MQNKYDLIVAGGGFAGVCAAISAAREGISVLLIEKSNCLGGAAVNSLVNPFMPFHTKINGKTVSLSMGIFIEIIGELQKLNAIDKKLASFDEEILKYVLNKMAVSAGVKLLYHSWLCGIRKSNSKIESVSVNNKSGIQEFFADYFIDATGDADLSVLSGVPYRLGREKDRLCQPMTLCFRLSGVDIDRYKQGYGATSRLYIKMRENGKIKNPRENILIFPTLHDGILHFNSTRVVRLNPVDAFDKTRAEIEAREQVFELYEFLKKHADGFENCRLLSTAMEIGVRESRMIDGEYLLTEDDLKKCTRFEDCIALGNYDVDIHNPEGTGTSHYYFREGEYYDIPYRSLVPLNITNLLVAGRCVSATHEAQASIRILPIVSCIGHAAGVGAAVAFKSSTAAREASISKIREILQKQGAVLTIR
ncbi:MAG: FAD-dependent oxidoreductase [Oscillospiraceae bacterium]|nr:FAD-dependent oxidoreductase [Oscillospiraceae bacterium]